jgi:DNA-binding CsgD family transcriptional regulator/PAS domain-containing protein
VEFAGVDGQVPDTGRHIDRIYRAAAAPERWPAFLGPLSQELRARTIHLSFRLPCDGDRGVLLSLGMDERFEDAYRSHFHILDPWRPLLGMEEEGDVRRLEEFVPGSKLARTEFYNDWMRPQDIFHGFAAFLLHKSGPKELVSSLAGFREKSSGPFQEEDLARIRLLVPHLQRALAIHRRIQAAEMRAGATEEALDRIFGGVILLDERGAPVATNRAADQILASQDGLSLGSDGPRAAVKEQARELQHLLTRAAKTGAGGRTDPGGVLRLARPSGRPALEVVVTPIRRESSPLFDVQATAAIFVAEPDARVEGPPERLRRIYGFTPTEAEVASRLARGMRLPEIAEDLGITLHTVRAHLKRLFFKTDTHRQAELVRVMVAGPARLRLD